ncbi:PepSY domain-containing protein [Halalkalibacter okhensis]|uniref:PepSY domain-containing protein n=1 Tax=Halalkalibacter okhensis TaxID=333138 RepID=UPI000689AF08|nr:PepSY domain-containing protein [Halalkalibacter okhensis]
MKKWPIIVTSLVVAGAATMGVAAADKDPSVANESEIVLEKGVAEEASEQSQKNDKRAKLTKEQAISKVKEVLPGQIKEIELDSDDGEVIYEVELKYEGNDYDFEVDAFTGEIIEIDDDLLKTPIAEDMKIDVAEAKKRAIESVGEGSVKEIELEKKWGQYVYEIEAKIKGEDGDIYVDAMSGEVLYIEDDLLKMISAKQDSVTEVAKRDGERLTAQEASNIALNYVKGGTVEDLDLEFEKGRLIYEIEIERENGEDVDVDIDAYTGEILAVDWD